RRPSLRATAHNSRRRLDVSGVGGASFQLRAAHAVGRWPFRAICLGGKSKGKLSPPRDEIRRVRELRAEAGIQPHAFGILVQLEVVLQRILRLRIVGRNDAAVAVVAPLHFAGAPGLGLIDAAIVQADDSAVALLERDLNSERLAGLEAD